MKEIKKSGERNIRLRPYIKIAFFSFLAFALVGICLFSALFYDGYDEYDLIEIPNIYGILEDDIVLPDNIKLLKSYEYTSDELACRVIYQSAVGEKKSSGEYTLLVKIGLKKERYTLPNLIGKSEDSAKDIIKSLGGCVNVEYIDSLDNEGVVYQSPKAGAVIYKGDTVEIFVSRNNTKKSVCVPSLEGTRIGDAIAKIKEMGLSLGKIDYLSCDDMESGVVLSQSLPDGSYVCFGREINLKVSRKTEINQMKESRKNIWMTKKRAE